MNKGTRDNDEKNMSIDRACANVAVLDPAIHPMCSESSILHRDFQSSLTDNESEELHDMHQKWETCRRNLHKLDQFRAWTRRILHGL